MYYELDETVYEKGLTVTDEEMAQVNLRSHEFHEDWNYTIIPTRRYKKQKK